jgi:hypothetical protein
MNKVKNFIAISVFSLMVLALPSVASAQWYPGGNNGPYYGGQVRDLRDVARRLKDDARNFERLVERTSNNNRGGWGNNRGNDTRQLRSLASDFRRAADNFQSRYGNGRNLRNSEDAARRLLDSASRLDQGLRYARVNNQLRSDFSRMRPGLNMVAQTYGYNRGNNRYPDNRSGDWRNRIPFPLPF